MNAAASAIGRLFILLRREGEPSGVNRIHRLYREEGLSVRKRRARRKAVGARAPILVEARPNARWSTDFVHDQFANGRRFRVLNIVDDVTKQCLGAIPDTSISGRRVARELTAIIARHGKPGMIVSDHGTEYTCNAMLAWCRDNGIDWHFIAPGKPMQNGFVESFNGRRCATSFSMRPCSSISMTLAPRSPPGSPTSTPRVRIRPSAISRPRPTPPISPQRAIGCATPTSSADRPLLPPRHTA
jgi:transposase InsO family protein